MCIRDRLRRVGQTEASVDLAELAGLPAVGVICEILDSDGTMARRPQLQMFAKEHGLKFITVAQLVAYRLTKTRIIERLTDAQLPTQYGEFRVIAYQSVPELSQSCLLYTSPSPRDGLLSRMPSSA